MCCLLGMTDFPLLNNTMATEIPASFRARPDSPHPFRLGNAPRSRPKKVKHESTEQNAAPQTVDEADETPLIDTKQQTLPQIDDAGVVEPLSPSLTQYMRMLLQLDKIPELHNILAGIFTWLLLAGYIVLPGAFTSLSNSKVLADGAGKAGKMVVKAVQNLPLLGVGIYCCAAGAIGMSCLGWVWRVNYVWLVNRLIL